MNLLGLSRWGEGFASTTPTQCVNPKTEKTDGFSETIFITYEFITYENYNFFMGEKYPAINCGLKAKTR